jgi:hypothetical protein
MSANEVAMASLHLSSPRLFGSIAQERDDS